jgi:serine-type D-Ala-D-Ala carboxypeptidase/endopeptidase
MQSFSGLLSSPARSEIRRIEIDPSGGEMGVICRRFRRSLLLLCALLLPVTLGAQSFPANEDLEAMLRFLVEDRETQGIVLGIREADGSVRLLHYGSAGPDLRPLGPRSVFDIGSITKTFTATVLAEMVLRGEVALEDPIAKYLPPQVTVPSREGREITLLDLATHTSGLPRLPTNFRPADLQDPYAYYTLDLLYAFLRDHELRAAPGESYEYSNLGYGLLGHALAHAGGMSFRDLVRERVLEPLEMEATGYALRGDAAGWMVQGHRFGAVVPTCSVGEAMEGAGGLRSSAEDMLKYLEANIRLPSTGLERAMRLAQAVQMPGAEAGAGQGLAWRTLVTPRGARIVEHGGASAGFQARVALMPERGVGSVVLTNEGQFRDALGMDLLRHAPLPADWNRIRVAPDVLKRYAGEYDEVSAHGRFYVRLEGEGYLTFQPGGQVRVRLYATSDTTFFMLRHPWSLTFRKVEGGEGVEMLIQVDERRSAQQGLTRAARRIGPITPRRRSSPVRKRHRFAVHSSPCRGG